MRRLLRWLTNLVCVVCLLLGLACLIAWPVSYWREFAISRETVEVYQNAENYWVSVRRQTEIGVTQGRFGVVHDSYDDTMAFEEHVLKPDGPNYEFYDDDYPDYDLPWFQISFADRLIAGEPLGPVWGNATPNIVVFAPTFVVGIVFFLLAVPAIYLFRRRLRRKHRLQSGLCLYCGYNLHGITSDTCPECGQARAMVTVQSD